MIFLRFFLNSCPLLLLRVFHVNSSCNDGSTVLRLLEDASKLWHCVVDKNKNLTPSESNVFFRLYTRRNRNQAEILIPSNKDADVITKKNDRKMSGDVSKRNDTSLESEYFDFNIETKILIHGYSETMSNSKMMDIKNAYLERAEYNVIVVDWSLIANSTCYVHAAISVPVVGELTGRLLNRLFLFTASHGPIHLLGFSLGAHVAGFAGKTARRGIVKRITGLDPALPMFITKNPAERLHRTDAEYVDIIHTCGGILGMNSRIGHADFYPNGGFQQTGCCDVMCSHGRAPIYYYESVLKPDGFKALRCESWRRFLRRDCNVTFYALMGDACSEQNRGSFYLKTSNSTPYSLSVDGLGPFSRHEKTRVLSGSLTSPKNSSSSGGGGENTLRG